MIFQGVLDDAGCIARGCVVSEYFSPVNLITRVQHGENPEAVLDTTYEELVSHGGNWLAQRFVEWARRVHEYEDRRAPHDLS